jgi:uncharacterized protein (DUF427 family)
MSGRTKITDPDHPITVQPTRGRVVVRARGTLVADSRAALTLREASYPPVQYLPLSDVEPSALRRTGTATYCPYKGDACYYSVITGDGEIADAGWSYERPYDAVAQIAGHVAFYPDRVQVEVEAADGE